MAKITIDKIITIDDSGMPKPPNIKQLQDKDVLMLYTRDLTSDKRNYIKECGVVYYMGDPKSPARSRGFSDKETLKEAIDNYDLPKNYTPDVLVKRLIDKYYIDNITEAGVALEALQRSIHLVSLSSVKINELLSKRLEAVIGDEEIPSVLNLMDSVGKRINEIPSLIKALSTAYDNLKNEEESAVARGGQSILSSMDADED